MAVPLRKVSGGYDVAAPAYRPRQQERNAQKTAREQEASAKRLVRRQVKSNADFRRALALVFLGMALVLFLLGISYTFVKAGVSHLSYQVNALQQENEVIVMENEKLRGRIAELRSLSRIEFIASMEIGLVKNNAVEYMVLSTDVVEEGKLRQAEVAEEEEKKDKETPFAAAVEFLLSWKNK